MPFKKYTTVAEAPSRGSGTVTTSNNSTTLKYPTISYTPVSAVTGTRRSFTYTPFEYDKYTKSQEVLDAEQKKKDAEKALAEYGDFLYRNQTAYDDVINKILNREKFSYDLNGDALYQMYKDKYIQEGKMASANVMGQAAAMTGGYGNSYAASVGNQAYQASLQNLNDIVPELYQMAYDRYNQEGQDLYNQFGMLSSDKSMEYGMWGDKRNALMADRDYYSNDYNNAYNRDYSMYIDDRNLAHSEHTTSEGYKYQDVADANAWSMWAAGQQNQANQFNASMQAQADQFNATMEYQAGRDSVADYQWKQEFGLKSAPTTTEPATTKPFSMSFNDATGVLTKAAEKANGGKDSLRTWLNSLVSLGSLSQDAAADIFLQYFPEKKNDKIDTTVSAIGNGNGRIKGSGSVGVGGKTVRHLIN